MKRNIDIKYIQRIGLIVVASFFVGCTATQPVKWNLCAPIDLKKGVKVLVEASCKMPSADISYLQGDIQQKVRKVLAGNPELSDAYKIKVTITRYDKGNAFARFMLIGLGQMYLYGTIEVKQGNPPVVIRSGKFKKNYCIGGISGGIARMEKDVLPKVGKAIADAVKQQQKK
jgi:hypothetical protein